MTPALLYGLTAVALCAIGLHGALAQAHLLRRILALNILGAGVFLLFVALPRRAPHFAPDPVPQALVLTGIVVAVCVSALALALLRRLQADSGRSTLPEDDTATGTDAAGPARDA